MLRREFLALCGLGFMVCGAQADSVADFYRGKTVQLVVGYGPGGGYDVYARVIGRHLGKYIPGQPAVAVVNMPGAGSLRSVNYLYNTAPKDGTVIGAFARDMPLMGVLGGNSNVQFDPRKLTWLGSASSAQDDAYVLFVRKDAAAKSIEEARKPGGPAIVLAGTAEGATGNDVAVLLRDTLGINLRVITGYPDSGAIFLAVDRKEVDGRFVGLSAVQSSKQEWLKPDGNMRVLMQFARTSRHKLFLDAPTARELAPNERARALIELAELPYLLSRPMAAPPGLPPERAAALQKAFLDLQKDPDYLAECARLGLDISPVGGDEALVLIDKLSSAPPDLLEALKKLQHPEK